MRWSVISGPRERYSIHFIEFAHYTTFQFLHTTMDEATEVKTHVQNEPYVLADVINAARAVQGSSTSDSEGDDQPRSIDSYNPHKEVDTSNESGAEQIESSNDEPQEVGAPLEIVKTRFFSKRLVSHRRRVVRSFLTTNILYICVIFTILLMFWGSNAYTTKYYHKLKLLAVFQDDVIPEDLQGKIPSLTGLLAATVAQYPGKWSVFNTTGFENRYGVQGTEQINDKVIERIYREHYWIALNVRPNVTARLYESLTNESAPLFNATDLFELVYETGREPTNMASGILPITEALEQEFFTMYTQQYFPQLLQNVTEDLGASQINMRDITTLAQMVFLKNDYRPFYRRALISPIQVGLIFAVILSIFHFMLYAPINQEMGKTLRPTQYMVYRIALTWGTFFFISLFYCTISAIFKIDFTKAFGRGGFVVYWMSTWLFMVACGGANENVLSLIFLYQPSYLGFWILFFIIINASTTFFPFALNSVFYRIGYMLPMHNAADLYRVIFFDLTRLKMGRNYGVLIAWIAINTLLAPIVTWHVGTTMTKRAKAQH